MSTTAETALAGLEVEPAIRVFIGIGLHGLINDSAFHVSCVTAVQACLMLIFQQGVDDQLILLLWVTGNFPSRLVVKNLLSSSACESEPENGKAPCRLAAAHEWNGSWAYLLLHKCYLWTIDLQGKKEKTIPSMSGQAILRTCLFQNKFEAHYHVELMTPAKTWTLRPIVDTGTPCNNVPWEGDDFPYTLSKCQCHRR